MLEQAEQRRGEAREIFLQALNCTTVRAAVERSVRCEDGVLTIAGLEYVLARHGEVCVVSLGKAGATLFDAVDALLPREMKRRAVVSAPLPPVRMDAGVAYFAGGHPEPNAASMAAARAALDAVSQCVDNALVLFLISGGASAMCELPLWDEVTLQDVVLMNRLLIACGAPIAEVNCVRKHLSRVKGGRLAVAAGGREKITLLVSDVPNDALDSLGSGPSLADNSTVEDCLAVMQRYGLMERMPSAIRRRLDEGLAETPKPGHVAFRSAMTTVLLGNGSVLEQAGAVARGFGYLVDIDNCCDDWSCEDAAKYLLARLEALRGRGRKVCLLSGGEVTIRLPEKVGVGGRNLQFCLYCAAQGLAEGMTVLSAGTDGVDGNSPAAGAVVDGTTIARGNDLGLDVQTYLHDFDAYSYFAPLGDAIVTGPTGNNLRDVRVLLWDEDAR